MQGGKPEKEDTGARKEDRGVVGRQGQMTGTLIARQLTQLCPCPGAGPPRQGQGHN